MAIEVQKSDLTGRLTVVDPIASHHNRDYRHGHAGL
jgi:hypothetical protein